MNWNKQVSKITKVSDDLYVFSTWDRETLQMLTMSVGNHKTMLRKAKRYPPSLSDWTVLILQLYSAGSFEEAMKQHANRQLKKDLETLPIINEKNIGFLRYKKQKFNSVDKTAKVKKIKKSLESYLSY